jgi:hypothetical protein
MNGELTGMVFEGVNRYWDECTEENRENVRMEGNSAMFEFGCLLTYPSLEGEIPLPKSHEGNWT